VRGNDAFFALWQGDLAGVEAQRSAMRQLADLYPEASRAAGYVEVIDAIYLSLRGPTDQAVSCFRSAATKARAAGDRALLTQIIPEQIELLFEIGAEREAEEAAREGRLLADQYFYLAALTRGQLAAHYARRGEIERARALISEAQDEASASTVTLLGSLFISWGEAWLAAAERRWSEALATFEALAGAFATAGVRRYTLVVLRAWADAYLARGDAGDRERGIALLREARAGYCEMGAHRCAGIVEARLEAIEAGA